MKTKMKKIIINSNKNIKQRLKNIATEKLSKQHKKLKINKCWKIK